MTYNQKRVLSQIERIGQTADVLEPTATSTDSFGHEERSFRFDREIITFRTYPNRNTLNEGQMGNIDRDSPVFICAIGTEQPPAPSSGDRLRYDGRLYEIAATTPYDTHIELTAQQVINE